MILENTVEDQFAFNLKPAEKKKTAAQKKGWCCVLPVLPRRCECFFCCSHRKANKLRSNRWMEKGGAPRKAVEFRHLRSSIWTRCNCCGWHGRRLNKCIIVFFGGGKVFDGRCYITQPNGGEDLQWPRETHKSWSAGFATVFLFLKRETEQSHSHLHDRHRYIKAK